MTTATDIDLDLEVDIDKEIVCEMRWWAVAEQCPYTCSRPASWVAMVHDEVTDHKYYQLLFCGSCYMQAILKKVCMDDSCAKLLILKARRL